jgi:multicomponent Na+:H+ antiporter subunit D
MKFLLVLPILIPLVAAALQMASLRAVAAQRAVSLASAAALLASAAGLLIRVDREGILVDQVGSWAAPFGITLVADLFSAVMVLLAAIVGFCVVLYSLAMIDPIRERHGYHPALQALQMGVCGSFLTGDLFNLYVWFEVMLMSSFVLLTLGSERAQLEGGIKYVTLNLLSSALFLAGIGLLYGMTGTLNLADLSTKLRGAERAQQVLPVAMLLLIAFGIKAAVFPLFFWLPASYHTPPSPVSAIFAGLLTKVGVYSILRTVTLLFGAASATLAPILLVTAGLTMVTGVLGAAAQREFRRVLAFHIVSQIGYILMGLGLMSLPALAGAIFFLAHVILVKSTLFLAAGAAQRIRGTGELRELGGLYASNPLLSLLFLVSALSIAGIPPLSGFFAKLALVRAGLERGSYVIVAMSLGVSLLTLYSMTKIWNEAFWKPAPPEARPPGRAGGSLPAIVLMTAAILALSVAAGPIFELSERAAAQLFDVEAYARAVLGEEAPR